MKYLSLLLIACLTVSCTTAAPSLATTTVEHPEARPFDAKADAKTDVDEMLFLAEAEGKRAILVMGANWCHDSRALAGWFATSRFQALLNENYIVRYVDVGQKNRNIDIAQRFGLNEIVGTPTIFAMDAQGEVLNLETAPSWRNAASRTEDEIFNYFEGFVQSQ